MAKTLRLHSGGKETIVGWGDSEHLGQGAIDKIKDPEGAKMTLEITSIPSPFARIDLVKRAFAIVADGRENLNGLSAYDKLVSDALDIGQLFFEIEKRRDLLEILVWDRERELAELKSSRDASHVRLGKTYRTYLQQDASEYRFDIMDKIYLLNYVGPGAKSRLNIIGATSPATLFFTSANDFKFIGDTISFGDDKPFDEYIRPLYTRNKDYILWWYRMQASIKDFAAQYPEVHRYLESEREKLPDSVIKQLPKGGADGNVYQETYAPIPVTPNGQEFVKICGIPLRCLQETTSITSGFTIASTRNAAKERMPLVLPIDPFDKQIVYVKAPWQPDTKVPAYDPAPLAERKLPVDGSKYPYLTVSDLLEDYLVAMPWPLNNDGYFSGRTIGNDKRRSYLLPLKAKYFEYFTPKDLQTPINGKPPIEMESLGGNGARVVLRVPIVGGGYVQYERRYYEGKEPDLNGNKGGILSREVTLGIYPGLRYPENIPPYYSVALLDRDSVSNRDTPYTLEFFNSKNEAVNAKAEYRNRNNSGNRLEHSSIDLVAYVLKDSFEYIRVKTTEDSTISGVIVPKLQEPSGGAKYRVAVDFGTTNTHVEIRYNGGESMAFTIAEHEKQVLKLHPHKELDRYIKEVFDSDFIPDTIGNEAPYSYPMRTALSERMGLNWVQLPDAMAMVNIPFTYEKRMLLPYNEVFTDLKWSPSEQDRIRAKKYIECLLLMIRNKVLLGQGDIEKTELLWFYPLSMQTNRFNLFKEVWEEQFTHLFHAGEGQVKEISESLAPFYYNKKKKQMTSTGISIDIGGGTTDVLFVDDGAPRYMTSFTFAGNAIFGDGYASDADDNGFVRQYKDDIDKRLRDAQLDVLANMLKEIEKKKRSADIVDFFFSLEENQEVKTGNNAIKFGDLLAHDGRGKYAILLFFTAVMYHTAHLMKAIQQKEAGVNSSEELKFPRHISFSGNGAKVLNILTCDNGTLAQYIKLIFERVFDKEYPSVGLEILRPDQPKMLTCKGGLTISANELLERTQVKAMSRILLGVDGETFVDEKSDFNGIDQEKLRSAVVDEVNRFIDFTFALGEEFSFYDNFGVDLSIVEEVKQLCRKDLRNYLDCGIKAWQENEDAAAGTSKIEETLFFFPIIGMINSVMREIYNMKSE